MMSGLKFSTSIKAVGRSVTSFFQRCTVKNSPVAGKPLSGNDVFQRKFQPSYGTVPRRSALVLGTNTRLMDFGSNISEPATEGLKILDGMDPITFFKFDAGSLVEESWFPSRLPGNVVLKPTSISQDLVPRFWKDSEDHDGKHSGTNGIDDDDDDDGDSRWWYVLVAALCTSIVPSNRLVLANNDAPVLCETDDERVNRLFAKVMEANRDSDGIQCHQWVVSVNDIPGDVFNMMIGDGPVIVAVPVDLIATANDDQLMYVIARQIAQHLLEYDSFIRGIVGGHVPIFVSKPAAALLLYHKPADPELLLEADREGLMMAARAGMDPDEAYRFWMEQDKWHADSENGPKNLDRAKRMKDLAPEARRIRKTAVCSEKKPKDS